MRHLQGLVRRVGNNESVLRLFIVDRMVDLIDEYINVDEATKVIDLYMSLLFDDGKYQYNDFQSLLKDVLSSPASQDVPKMVKHRFKIYMEYLFPTPLEP